MTGGRGERNWHERVVLDTRKLARTRGRKLARMDGGRGERNWQERVVGGTRRLERMSGEWSKGKKIGENEGNQFAENDC